MKTLILKEPMHSKWTYVGPPEDRIEVLVGQDTLLVSNSDEIRVGTLLKNTATGESMFVKHHYGGGAYRVSRSVGATRSTTGNCGDTLLDLGMMYEEGLFS